MNYQVKTWYRMLRDVYAEKWVDDFFIHHEIGVKDMHTVNTYFLNLCKRLGFQDEEARVPWTVLAYTFEAFTKKLQKLQKEKPNESQDLTALMMFMNSPNDIPSDAFLAGGAAL